MCVNCWLLSISHSTKALRALTLNPMLTLESKQHALHTLQMDLAQSGKHFLVGTSVTIQ